MKLSKFFTGLIVLCSMCFLISDFYGNQWLANTSRALVVPLFAVLYIVTQKKKSPYFLLFLLSYGISDLISIFGYNQRFVWEYYIGNALYIVAYLSLSIGIMQTFPMIHILKHFKWHTVILILLNLYVNYILVTYETPYLSDLDLGFELLYNIATLVLVSVSLLNYFYRDDQKAFVLFLGALALSVSEVIQITYYYNFDTSESGVMYTSYSLLIILGFTFFFYQSKLDYEDVLVYA